MAWIRSAQIVAGAWHQVGAHRVSEFLNRRVALTGAQNVCLIGLRPFNDDAHCPSALADFANGPSHQLAINLDGKLKKRQVFALDLRGNQRSIRGLSMDCEGLRGMPVPIQGLALG
jgi:hypothetical protein